LQASADGPIYALAISPDGKTLAVGSHMGLSADWVRLFDMETLKEKGALKGHGKAITALAFSADGKWLASGSKDCQIGIWDLKTGKARVAIPNAHPRGVNALVFTPDGATLISGGGRLLPDETYKAVAEVRYWDAATGKPRPVAITGMPGDVVSLALSSDGKVLAGGYGQLVNGAGVKLWDAATGKELATISDKLSTPVQAVAFSPDDKAVAVGWPTDGTIRLFDPATGKELGGFIGHKGYHNSIAFAPDGQTLVSSDQNEWTLKAWDRKEMRPIAFLQAPPPEKPGPTKPAGPVVYKDAVLKVGGGGDLMVVVVGGKDVFVILDKETVYLDSDGKKLPQDGLPRLFRAGNVLTVTMGEKANGPAREVRLVKVGAGNERDYKGATTRARSPSPSCPTPWSSRRTARRSAPPCSSCPRRSTRRARSCPKPRERRSSKKATCSTCGSTPPTRCTIPSSWRPGWSRASWASRRRRARRRPPWRRTRAPSSTRTRSPASAATGSRSRTARSGPSTTARRSATTRTARPSSGSRSSGTATWWT
jgi:WD40 repeat protein